MLEMILGWLMLFGILGMIVYIGSVFQNKHQH